MPSADLLESTASGRRTASDTVERLHRAAVADLVWPDSAGNSIERSINSLDAISHLGPEQASAAIDESAAHLALAERRAAPGELLPALDDASRAMTIQPGNPAAAFNRALALDMLGVANQAALAWRHYLTLDSTSEWAREAKDRVQALSDLRDDATPPAEGAPDSTLRRWVRRAPAQARVFGWEKLLGAWGRAVLGDQQHDAATALSRATAIAATLCETHGDQTLAGEINIIRSAGDRYTTRRLAEAHALFAAGQAAYAHASYDVADTLFRDAGASAPRSAMDLRAWIHLGRASTRVYLRHIDEGEAMAREVAAGADSSRAPALFGVAYWRLGAILSRRGSYAKGLDALRVAQRTFARIGERENAAAVNGVIGDVLSAFGDVDESTVATWRALRATRAYPGSLWRHNALLAFIRMASAERLPNAASALAAEDVGVAAANGALTYVAEASLVAAQAERELGDSAKARRLARDALNAIDRHEPGTIRNQLDAQFDALEAAEMAHLQPATAVALADSAIAFFRATRNPVRLVPLFVTRGDAMRARGRLDSAEAAYRVASAEVDRQWRGLREPAARAALRSVTSDVTDRLLMLLVDENRVADAFAFLERSNATRKGVPTGDAEIAYLLLGDTLVTFVNSADSQFVVRSPSSRERMNATIERVNAKLELGISDAQVRDDLAWLYDQLVAPFARRLGPSVHALTILADGDIGELSFAALYDSRRQSFLVQRYALAYASRLAAHNGWEPRPAAGPRQHFPVFVAAPTPAGSSGESFVRLDRADDEVRAASRLYLGAVTRTDAAADSAVLIGLLQHASMFHFAGHAVFDEANPDRSFLALTAGHVTAAELARLDLRGLDLVVLSACDAARSGRSHRAGLVGIADAFLAAGAEGVVGPTWQVADSTSAEMMLAFHHAYSAHLSAAAALRKAQLELLSSEAPAATAPIGWAAFRFVTSSPTNTTQ